jgi:LuxR family maltose regulon positive regulatory protein
MTLLQNSRMQFTALPPAFALAKIQPPRQRTSLVERPALERSLDAALRGHRLTLLVAPAGYGKTAALTRQIRLLGDGCALAWVSADADDQLQRFLACLTTALEPHDLPWRVSPEALGTLAQAEHGLRDVAHELVNALAAAEVPRGLIVIDDAHRIADAQVFELLQRVIERLPEHWGVAIASRVDPPLSLARWRAGGELAEFRQHELRFNEAEVDAMVRSSGLDGAAGSASELLALTDGWAAGLRLSLSAQAGHRGSGGARAAGVPAQRHLFDFLASEVLDDMPADLRRFLLRCSVLPELTAARCAHVARMPQAARLLEEVERRGLFVATLDADELTLRLHDLFRDFLESRLQRDQPEELPHLLRRAADHESDLVRAVGYLARAADWDRAARLLAEGGPALITRGGGPAVEQMLALFPPAEFEPRAALHLLRGGTAFPRFDFDGMVAAMQRAADGFHRDGRAADAALAQAYACLGRQNTGALDEAVAALAALSAQPLPHGVRAFVGFCCAWGAYAQGRSDAVAGHVAAMLDALEQADETEIWDRCFFLSILTGLPGMRPLLRRFADGATRLTGDEPTQLRAGVMHIRAWLAFAQGDTDEAAAWLARADDDCRWLGRPRSLMTENWMAHTLIDAVRGDREASYAAAQDNKRDLEQHSLRSNRLCHEYEELFTFIRAAWVLDDEAQLRALDRALARTGNPHEWAAAEDDRRFSQAMVALYDGRLDDAAALLQPLAEASERSCFFPAAQARLVLVDTLWRLGRHAAAADTLRPWCDAALAGADVGGALLAGPRVLRRLAAAAWGPLLTTPQRALLQRLAQRAGPHGADPVAPSAPAPVRPAALPAAAPVAARGDGLPGLTEREREVLARMAAGDSNKLIARSFDLSPHTVKRHVANILDKLGVATRGQAAARWRDHQAG